MSERHADQGIADRSTERDWIKEAQAGSEAAMERLFREHWGGAHKAAFLVVHDWAAAEDIAQEAFMASIRSLERFDRRRPFGPWLHRIVVNRSIDWARARRSRREVGDRQVAETVAAPDHDRDPFLRDQLLAALGTLTPEHRAVIVLRYLFEYTPGEIAEMLDERRGTVNSRMRRALDHLANSIGEER
ncbi:MAG: RNA polymerase sigma factor [Solirubrobacterales bacterium]